MITNCYGIAEPALDVRAIKPISTIDVLLTPLVAFDNSGARIGMGGGYYDRTLAKWHQHYVNNKYHKPSPIGIAHNCQEVDKISPEAWDIPLPKIVTPTRVIHCCALKTSG